MTNIDTIPFETEQAYSDAVRQVRSMAGAYYDSAEVLADDATYDELLRRVAATERAHPEWKSESSPVHTVAAGAAAAGEVTHDTPMLSLDNVFSTDELSDWAARLDKLVGHAVSDYTVEPKLDGLAVAARYEEGRLVLLATRGTGRSGEDVTHNARLVSGLRARLSEPVTIEVRGECFLSDADFEAANALRLAAGERPFVNPRNAAAGALRADQRVYDLPLSFLAYGAVGLEHLDHAAAMGRLAALGVSTTAGSSAGMTRCSGIDEVVGAVERLGARRGILGFAVDGAVVKADRQDDQDAAGFTSRAPRWAIAYKFPAEARLTRLVDITLDTGRTGRMTPVAVLEPVFVGGTTITSATLNNVGHVAALDARIGDMVWVRRAGEVIPEVTAVQLSERPEHTTPWVPPALCPSCGSAWDTSQKVWYCSRGRSCQAAPSIRYAVSRPCLDIEGLGDKLVDTLVAKGLVVDVGDLYSLDAETLAGLDRMGTISAAKVIAEIDRSRSLPLSRIFAALGVRLTGVRMSRRIARHFRTMAAISSATVEDLAEVEGVGPIRAMSIVAELAELAPVVAKLAAARVNMVEPADAAVVGSTGMAGGTPSELPLAGRKVVVTGTVPGLTRTEAQEAVECLGGRASGSVSKLTDLVIVGEGAGSKEQKARDLGIEIMAAEDFTAIVAVSTAKAANGGDVVSGWGRPMVFLDVDGVVNRFPTLQRLPRCANEFDDLCSTKADGFPIIYSPEMGRRLAALEADIFWLTTWEGGNAANRYIAPLLGWEPLPTIARGDHDKRAGALGWWKSSAAEEVVAQHRRPFIWIDDELAPALEHDQVDWVHRCELPHLLISPETSLLPLHLDKIAAWIAAPWRS